MSLILEFTGSKLTKSYHGLIALIGSTNRHGSMPIARI